MPVTRRGNSPVVKRTVYIDGRKTQITLEDSFWSSLKEIARTQGVTVSELLQRSKSRAKGETCPPRSACLYSTASVQKEKGLPQRKTAGGRASAAGVGLEKQS